MKRLSALITAPSVISVFGSVGSVLGSSVDDAVVVVDLIVVVKLVVVLEVVLVVV